MDSLSLGAAQRVGGQKHIIKLLAMIAIDHHHDDGLGDLHFLSANVSTYYLRSLSSALILAKTYASFFAFILANVIILSITSLNVCLFSSVGLVGASAPSTSSPLSH